MVIFFTKDINERISFLPVFIRINSIFLKCRNSSGKLLECIACSLCLKWRCKGKRDMPGYNPMFSKKP